MSMRVKQLQTQQHENNMINNINNMAQMYIDAQKSCGFKKGDKVRIIRQPKDYEDGWRNISSSMDYTGKVGTVVSIDINGVLVSLSSNKPEIYYPYFVLEKCNVKKEKTRETNSDIKHPTHYNQYPVEVIEITRHMPFCLGNIVKYVLRAPFKDGVKDCNKAIEYVKFEIKNRDSSKIKTNVKCDISIGIILGYLMCQNTEVSRAQADVMLHIHRNMAGNESLSGIVSKIEHLSRCIRARGADA